MNRNMYTLKRSYPSLHKDWTEGDVITLLNKENNIYHVIGKGGSIDGNEAKNNPDFWQLLEEGKALLITEDGVKLFKETDKVIMVRKVEFDKYVDVPIHEGTRNRDDMVMFFHESNADEYILMNKSLFSLNDIINSMRLKNEWIELAKERANK